MEAKLKVEMVVPLKTSKDQNRRQKIFLIRIKWKKIHGEVQLAGFEVYLDPKMGDGFGRGFPLMSWQEEILKRGKDHSKCHRAI